MFTKAPKYATFITFGLPVLFLVATGVTWVIPATQNIANSLLAVLVGSGWLFPFLFANAVLSQLAGVMARGKNRNFSAFYLPGLLFSFVVPLIVASVVKAKPTK